MAQGGAPPRELFPKIPAAGKCERGGDKVWLGAWSSDGGGGQEGVGGAGPTKKCQIYRCRLNFVFYVGCSNTFFLKYGDKCINVLCKYVAGPVIIVVLSFVWFWTPQIVCCILDSYISQ